MISLKKIIGPDNYGERYVSHLGNSEIFSDWFVYRKHNCMRQPSAVRENTIPLIGCSRRQLNRDYVREVMITGPVRGAQQTKQWM